MRHWVRTAGVALMTVATASGSCQSTGSSSDSGPRFGACRVDTRGIEVEGTAVTDVLTARCDPSPISHTLEG